MAAAATVRPLRESTRTVGELLPLIKHYLLVESCLRKGAIKTAYHIVPGGLNYLAVPDVLGKAVRAGEANLGRDGVIRPSCGVSVSSWKRSAASTRL